MVLTLQVLNSDASLNNFMDIGVKTFTEGDDVELILRLIQPDRGIRYVADIAAVINVTFLKSDETELVKVASFPFADDRSIIKVSLSDTETADIISQNLVVDITEGSNTFHALLQNGLQRINLKAKC